MPGRAVLLSGPSCVGKGPLAAAVKQFHPEIAYQSVPVIKAKESRGGKPRPDDEPVWADVDYWRTAEEVKALKGDPRYIVGDCRGFPQAIDLDKVIHATSNLVFVEVYHTLGRQLRDSKYVKDLQIVTVFVTPLSTGELAGFRACRVSLTPSVKGLMVLKQLSRAAFQGKTVDREFLLDIEVRASDAVDELRSAPDYTYVIVNHDGEGAPNWRSDRTGRFNSHPEGDAGRSVTALVAILNGKEPSDAERWHHGTI